MRGEDQAAAARGFLGIALLSVLVILLSGLRPVAALEVPYEVEITGVDDPDLAEALRSNSLLIADGTSFTPESWTPSR